MKLFLYLIGLVLSLPGAAFGAHGFSDSSLCGAYIFDIVEFFPSPAAEGPNSGVGVLNFAANGTVTANLLFEGYPDVASSRRAGMEKASRPVVHRDKAIGTYSVNSNGTGHLTLSRANTPAPHGVLDPCLTLSSLNFVIIDHSGSSANYIDTSVGGNPCGGIEPYYGTLFQRAQKVKFSNATLSGSYLVSFLVAYPGAAQHGVGGGLLRFDGVSKVSGTVSFMGDPPSVLVAVTGTYLVNRDGSATIRFPSLRVSPFALGENWSVLIADGVGTHSVFIDTSNDAAGTTVGTLERQR